MGSARTVMPLVAALVAVIALTCACLMLVARSSGFSHLAIRIVEESADYGIPGITTGYRARITNRGYLPVLLEGCAYVDDEGAHGFAVPYMVQRWDDSRKRWSNAFEMGGESFCRTYPLGWVRAEWTSKILWPNQSVETEEEATGGREIFHRGDTGRWIVYPNLRTKGALFSDRLYSRPFTVEEEQSVRTGRPVRVGH